MGCFNYFDLTFQHGNLLHCQVKPSEKKRNIIIPLYCMKINDIDTYDVISFEKLTHCNVLIWNKRIFKNLPKGIKLKCFFPICCMYLYVVSPQKVIMQLNILDSQKVLFYPHLDSCVLLYLEYVQFLFFSFFW